jgi:hypothetical protein
VWLEYKAFRQYLAVFSDSMGSGAHLCHDVARALASDALGAAGLGDYAAAHLACDFMNTLLRQALNAGNAKLAYLVVFEIRAVLQGLAIASGSGNSSGNNSGGNNGSGSGGGISGGARGDAGAAVCAPGVRHGTEDGVMAASPAFAASADELAAALAGNLGYYWALCHDDPRGAPLAFIADTISHDLGHACLSAWLRGSDAHGALLSAFLGLQGATGAARDIPLGTVVARAKLATAYGIAGGTAYETLLRESLAGCDPADIDRAEADIDRAGARYFWEVSDRASNLLWLPAEQRKRIPQFFAELRRDSRRWARAVGRISGGGQSGRGGDGYDDPVGDGRAFRTEGASDGYGDGGYYADDGGGGAGLSQSHSQFHSHSQPRSHSYADDGAGRGSEASAPTMPDVPAFPPHAPTAASLLPLRPPLSPLSPPPSAAHGRHPAHPRPVTHLRTFAINFAALAIFAIVGVVGGRWLAGGGVGGLARVFDKGPLSAGTIFAALSTVQAILIVTVIFVSIVMVHLASSRFTPLVVTTFFSDPVIVGSLTMMAAEGFVVWWVGFSVREDHIPRWAALIAVVMVGGGGILIVPYASYILAFFSPVSVVARAVNDVVKAGGVSTC